MSVVSRRRKLVTNETTVAQNTDSTGEKPQSMKTTIEISERKWNQYFLLRLQTPSTFSNATWRMPDWPHAKEWPLQVVPLAVNTVQHPLPSPARCFKLGKALGRAIASYPEDLKVVVIGTGGMSHQLQGERAGLINKPFDLMFLETIVTNPDALAHLSVRDLVESAGSEGVELIMWLVMRGALGERVSLVHRHYHVPVSSTAAGVLVLENAA